MDKKITLIVVVIILIIIAVGVYFIIKPIKMGEQTPTSYNIQGMKVEIIKQGSGVEAKAGDKVTVNYTGTLVDGKKFDSSFDRNQPFQFTLGENRVIQGWELGVAGMKVGEKRKLTIPPELGYGAQAIGEIIPANSTLNFEIDLLAIN